MPSVSSSNQSSQSVSNVITGRPANAMFWSNSQTWLQHSSSLDANGMPETSSDLVIPASAYVVLDVANVSLGQLLVEGTIEFDNSTDHNLQADLIVINGGNLIIGWPNDPILTNVNKKTC